MDEIADEARAYLKARGIETEGKSNHEIMVTAREERNKPVVRKPR